MRFSTILSLLPLALSVAAINVTEPAKGAEVDVSGSFTVKWNSVDTDASTVDIVLVNNAVFPTVSEKIASGVDTSKGSYDASGLKGITSGPGFQINLLSTDAKNTGILAQSQQFDVTESKSSSATTTGTSSTVSSSSTSSTSVVSSETSSTASTSTGATTTETDASTTATGSSTTSTGTSTATKTSTKTGLTTSASSTGTATGSAAASATASTGAAMGLVAPGAAAGLLAGVLAFLFKVRYVL
ncbi:Cell wall beta-glucan synthesis [Penicillium digitatum]|uniref:Cell wall beta-glucan synthesis n=1 Tax=Penicillium digitatum TaxID=36651 RepID=A0A7T7BP22_PENDI|nr:Cell wall beta-glucan synthesis [Penicillium digitatum]